MEGFGGFMRYIKILTLFTFILSGAAGAHNEQTSQHRQHGAHIHGLAQVTLAVIGEKTMVTLQIPAGDILGFERKPENQQEVEQVDEHLSWLSSASWVSFADGVVCELVDKHAHTGLLEDDHQGHADIHVELAWQCDIPPKLNQIDIKLAKSYSSISEVQVEWLIENQTGRTTLSSQQTSLSTR